MIFDQDTVERIVEEVLRRLRDIGGGDNPEQANFINSKVLTESDVLEISKSGLKDIIIPEGTIITPLASDSIRDLGITVERGTAEKPETASSPMRSDMIAVGADHGGYEVKEAIRKMLSDEGRKVKDFGTFSSESVDYPDFALKVAESVASGESCTGIIVDGAGFSSAMVANKVPGILAATCWDILTAKLAREHVGANVMTVGGKVIGPALAMEMVRTWLASEFLGGRHERRVEKIKEVERKYIKT
jgi:RpiB/LacA/LacB family sugar-phosphate isomerase